MLFEFRVCQAVLSVHCNLVVTCWERADILILLCVMFSCVFVTFSFGVLGQVRYLIVSIPVFFAFFLIYNRRVILVFAFDSLQAGNFCILSYYFVVC